MIVHLKTTWGADYAFLTREYMIMSSSSEQELTEGAALKRSSISRPRNSVASSRGEGLGVEAVERRPSMARSEIAASSGSSGNEDSEDDSPDDLMWQRSMAKNNSGMDCTYWDIQKLIKYIKVIKKRGCWSSYNSSVIYLLIFKA
jgi:hypothetical protein